MGDFFGPIYDGVKFIGAQAKKYLNYHRKFNNYVDDFKEAQEKLHDRKVDIQQQLQDELRFGKKPKEEVKSWLKKIEEKIITRAQGVEVKVSKGKYLFRSCLGKTVDETTQQIKEVYDEGRFPSGLVVNDPSAAKVKLPIDELPTEELASIKSKVEEIYKYLMGDEVRKIAVYGIGGIGKTRIMKHVYNKLLEETKFSVLIWTSVSQDFVIRKLQKQIARQLQENLSDDEDTTTCAAKLSEMLRKRGRYVVFLDDVWSDFSLEVVGIPEPNADNGCKLILTTRKEDVVRSMGCKEVPMPLLLMDEAMQLFLGKVGQDMLPNRKIDSTMRSIVEECAGLPLAIVTVAGAMKGISDPLRWKNALKTLSGHTKNMKDVEEKVLGCLIFSYKHIGATDQYCFLYCALYPRDYEFEKEEIIECWIEDGLIDEMGTRKEMHDMGHDVLHRLVENCLLERVQNGTGVKMHDLVRKMALHVTERSPRFFVKAGMKLTELPDEQQWTEDLEKVSLMDNSIAKIPPNMLSLECQKLTTLLLSDNSLSEIPDSFFAHMPNLKILDLSRNEIVSLPNSLSNLEKLTALLLSYCKRLRNVPSLSKLKALKKLDLEGTKIHEIPQGLEALVNLRHLNLGFTIFLKEIPSGVLSKLYRLQHLMICSRAPQREEDLSNLNKLEVFEGLFIDVRDLSMYAGVPQRYLILVTSQLLGYERSYLKPCDRIFYSHEDNTKMVRILGFDADTGGEILLPSDMLQLELVNCSRVTSLTDICELKSVTDLKKCTVKECDNLEHVFSSWCASLQTLEVLELEDLENIKAIVGKSAPSRPGSFSSLKVISLSGCGRIKNLFSAISAVRDLHNLEEIHVVYCEYMKEIIASVEKGRMNANNTIKLSLPKLRKLRLRSLQRLKTICPANGTMVCDSLQELEIDDCPGLKRIPLYLPVENGQPCPPPSLKEIRVDTEKWWKSVKWDHPNAKDVVRSLLKFYE